MLGVWQRAGLNTQHRKREYELAQDVLNTLLDPILTFFMFANAGWLTWQTNTELS